MLQVNARILATGFSGLQRYLGEVLREWEACGHAVSVARAPRLLAKGVAGHLWEQGRSWGGDRLWSPANTGPMRHRDQVLTVHDLAPLDHPEWFSRSVVAYWRWVFPRVVRSCRVVICISSFTRERLLAQVPGLRAEVVVIPNGVRLPAPMPGTGGGRYLLAVGALDPRKNLDALLAAWQRALPTLPSDLELRVVGPRRLYARGAPAEVVGTRVRHLGFLSDADLATAYAGCQGLVSVPLYEGFGLPPLEALAHGRRCLVSDIPVHREIYGEVCDLVPPRDHAALAAGLARLARADPGDPGIRRAFAAERTWRIAAERIWAVTAR